MGEFIIAIVLTGILNFGSTGIPVVATCAVSSSENSLNVQGDIRCKIAIAGGVGLGISGIIYPLEMTVPDKSDQNYVYY